MKMNAKPKRPGSLSGGIVLAAAVMALPWSITAQADEVVVQNDSVVVNSSAIAFIGDFLPGDEAGARLTMPCDGRVVGVLVGWIGTFPANLSSTEQAIHFYEDGTFPEPGSELATLISPQLLSIQIPQTFPTINEFRFLDVAGTVPIDIPVEANDVLVVTLEFANATNIAVGGPNIVTDFDGCNANGSVLFSNATQTWFDSCSFQSGDIVIRLIVDCDEEGACCFPDGSCQTILPNDCAAQGGSFLGEGTDCATESCPQPDGACCIAANEICINLTQAECTSLSGLWQGAFTTCAETDCFPAGACCLTDGSCTDTGSENACVASGGTFQGEGTTCATVSCSQPCPSDVNGEGNVNVTDLLQLLSRWGPCGPPCPEDITGDGNVNVSDLLNLLADWGPCS